MANEGSKEVAQRVVADVGGTFTVGLAYIGDKLGLFKMLAGRERYSSSDLAKEAGLNERYVREWLKAMVAADYIERDAVTETYFMTPAQIEVFAKEGSSFFMGGAFQFALPSLLLTPRLMHVFKNGGGIFYSELGEEIAESIDRMHRPLFENLLTKEWLPAIPGLAERLRQGASVLDVGCGLGRSSIAVATAYPESTVVGLDPHSPSIQKARTLASERDAANVTFVQKTLEELPVEDRYDLIIAFDCIHDMHDPVGALSRIKDLLGSAGLFLWSEPTGSHNPLENRTPLGKMRANLSPFHCLTVSLASGGAGLGTLIGEQGARELAEEVGFAHFEKYDIDSQVQQFFGLRK